MKDNGKRANRSALIMRRTSRAKAEDFWFILLNSPVAWEDSRFNCSWFWEALASEEVKWFTRIGTYSGPLFLRKPFLQVGERRHWLRVLGNVAVSPPELGRGENGLGLGWRLQIVGPAWQSGPLCGPQLPPTPAILKSPTVSSFDLKASWEIWQISSPAASKMATNCRHRAHCSR